MAPIRWDLGGKTGPDLLGRNTIDTAKNRPELHKKAHLKWDRTHGTRVEADLEGSVSLPGGAVLQPGYALRVGIMVEKAYASAIPLYSAEGATWR